MNILETKIVAPPVPSSLVPRQRLIERFDESLRKKLTVVSAPAGSGKTTLVSEWISTRRRKNRVAWVSLGREDNDPFRFWQYLIAAISPLSKEKLSSPGVDFSSPKTDDLDQLINWVNANAEYDFTLVLDDYHLIQSEEIHTALTYLLDYQPRLMHIVVASRTAPPLPVAQLRVRSQCLEFTREDLKFSDPEASTYFTRVAARNLRPEEVEKLNARAEGWVAGLQIAALSLRNLGPDTLHGFWEDFSGTNHMVGEYFWEQVLKPLDSETVNFLLRTSILERFNASLAAAVTEATAVGEILNRIECGNLFLVRLDNRGEWFRYHHLFSDFLLGRLKREYPVQFAFAHVRAAEWFEEQNQLEAAVEHALKAGDIKLADRLILRVEEALWGRHEFKTLARWFEALPTDFINSRPDLCLSITWMIALNGNLEDMTPYLSKIESYCQRNQAESEPAAWRFSVTYYRAHVSILRGHSALFSGRPREAINFLKRALELIPQSDDCRERALACMDLGAALYRTLDLDEAIETLKIAARVSRNCAHHSVHVAALFNLASAYNLLGRVDLAEEHYNRCCEYANESNSQILAAGGRSGLADIHIQQNRLAEAETELEQRLEMLEKGGSALDRIVAYIRAARLRQAQENWDAAQSYLHKAYQVALRAGVTEQVESVKFWQARLWIVTRNLTAARHWAEQMQSSRLDIPVLNEAMDITLARLYLAEGKTEVAIQLLDTLLQNAREGKRVGSEIEIATLLALACRKSGQRDRAHNILNEVLLAAEMGEWVRVFLDEGAEMKSLLQETIKINPRLMENPSTKQFLENILKAFPAPSPNHSAAGKQILNQPLIEPLSGRELQVLSLLAAGKSYEQAAGDLFVALSTIQWHVKNIYQKLNVHSGSEAVAVARNLKIIS